MMARIGNVGPEAISRSDRISNGLTSAMREHQMSMAPSRVDMLLGISSRPQSPPVYDTTEFNEEDVWGMEDGVVGGISSSSSTGNIIGSGGGGGGPSSNAGMTTSPMPGLGVGDMKKYDVSFVGGAASSNGNTVLTKDNVSDSDPIRLLNNGRRWPGHGQGREKDPGLSMAFTEAARARGFGASLNRASPAVPNASLSSAVANGGHGGRTSSRLIPSRGGDGLIYASASPGGGGSRMLHQSAPVNVPDWSKILGAERNSYQKKVLAEDVVPENDEDEDERLPPHELVARDIARSQATNSMLEGAGRTLKGRDQSRVRNAVLRRTGFLTDH